MVFEGLGSPCTSESRPMKLDGPTLRHRNAATNEESSDWADNGAATSSAVATRRDRCMTDFVGVVILCGTQCGGGSTLELIVAEREGKIEVSLVARF